MRNARHLNKFLFIMRDELFYQPFESHYKPSSEYIDLVTELSKKNPGHWRVVHDGFWVHVQPSRPPRSADEPPRPVELPAQGWKIHVSATLVNDLSVLRKAAKVALSKGVPFKFIPDRNLLSLTSSKAWPRGRSGKFLTLYPLDFPCFESLLEDLHAELRDENGPYVLSDRRYKDCRVLYYRYGGIERATRLEITGTRTPVLKSPEGETVPDVRTPYFAPPAWVTDPFPTEETAERDLTLNDGRYVVKEALSFSNSGGVYAADDRETGNEVVVKEARPYTLMDRPGNDAIGLLEKEHAILQLLRDTGVAAEPVEAFYAWENLFLAQEYVRGLDVREIMLSRTPLMRVEPSLEESRRYYEIFTQIFTSFLRNLGSLHERGIVFGDLSANNLKVDPSTWAVRFVDFEGAYRRGVDEPTPLFTPGFKRESSVRGDVQGFGEDLYSLAAIMLYMLFPLSALASLRQDLFDTVLPRILADAGWSETEVLTIVRGLSKNEITCAQACALLERPAEISPPKYAEDIEVRSCDEIVEGLGRFLLGSMRGDSEEGLFPADPFVHQTNALSLGFGASGVLYALKTCGFEIPERALGWLERELAEVKAGSLAPGLLTGASGIAWCLGELGLEDRAEELMTLANESPLLEAHHSYLYGMAGVGMANLFLYGRTNKDHYLEVARHLAESLRRTAREDDRGLYWERDEVVQLGFGYGQSGVALFLLRLSEVTGDEEVLASGRRALEFDLSHGVENENGGVSFPCAPSDPTLLTYLEEGSAGVAKVAMRYGLWERTEPILCSAHRKYATFAGLLYGLGSFVDVFTDAFLLSGDGRFLEMAKRPLCGIRDLYLIEKGPGLATPGDGLLRVSCDYATGVAGVLRAVHRFSHLGAADFVLDEVAAADGEVLESARSGGRRHALTP